MQSATVEDRTIALVRAHQNEIWRYLRYLGCPGADAEDLTQDTFLAVLRRPFADRGPISTAAYLRRVARNLFLKARERTARRPEPANLDGAEEVWRRFCVRDGGARYVEALRECLGELPGRSHQAIERRYGQGQSRGHIATELGMSVDGVKSLLRRVRKILRECVERRVAT